MIETLGIILGIIGPIFAYAIKQWIDGKNRQELDKAIAEKNLIEQEKVKHEWNEATKKVNEAIQKQREALEKINGQGPV